MTCSRGRRRRCSISPAGTGDISFGWLKRGGGPVFLTDINRSMLSVGRDRALNQGFAGDVSLVVADAEKLPLPDRCVDRVSIAFGLRNCTDKAAVLREARRVLKPGGRFLCLEFSRVTVHALTRLYDAWSFKVLPRLGPHGRRRRGQLPLSRRKHPDLPGPGNARRDDARGRILPGSRCATSRAASPRSIRDGGYEPGRQARPADHLRRDCGLQGAGIDPAAAPAGLRRHLRADRQRRAVRYRHCRCRR